MLRHSHWRSGACPVAWAMVAERELANTIPAAVDERPRGIEAEPLRFFRREGLRKLFGKT